MTVCSESIAPGAKSIHILLLKGNGYAQRAVMI